jgi:hypothetical protein
MSIRLKAIVGRANSSVAVADVCWAEKGAQDHAGGEKEMLGDLHLWFVCVREDLYVDARLVAC